MCKTIDLHTHSYCSDGTFSPEGLVILAKKQGLSAIALTDHDTIDGLELFLEAGEKHGIETICGIEFAALYEGFHRPEIHIVGLGFDRHDPMLLEKLEEIRQSRDDRNERMAKQLTAIGLPVSLEEVAHNAGGEIITRAHFANVLLEKKLIKDRKEAFSKYLSPGCPGYVERQFLTPKRLYRSHQKRWRRCCSGTSHSLRFGYDPSGNPLQRIDFLWSGRHRMPLLHLHTSPDKSRGKNCPHFGASPFRRQ